MTNLEIPIYLITGFLDGGKTSFLKETMNDTKAAKKFKTLLIQCEEGEEEFSQAELKKLYIDSVSIAGETDLSTEFFNNCDDFYQPDRVLIEYNGMWNIESFFSLSLPEGWMIAQVISVINAQTFKSYLANMRSILLGQVKYSDTIIVNRCDAGTDKTEIRRSIKPLNRKGQILYESADGIAADAGEDELPYDVSADEITIEEEDYGLFYMDAMDHPQKYQNKIVHFLAMVYHSKKMPSDNFIAGRFAMTCCVDDVAFVGMLCKPEKGGQKLSFDSLKSRQYIRLTAKVRCEYYKEYNGKGPILYVKAVRMAEEPEEPVVYFR